MTEPVPLPPARRRRHIRIPTEAAARTATAITIGTSGEEEPPSLEWLAGLACCWSAGCGFDACALLEPESWLPWPVPPLLPPPPEPPPEEEDEPVDSEVSPSVSVPPLDGVSALELVAVPFSDFGLVDGCFTVDPVLGVPVAVGGASEYWMPLESA